MTNPPGLVNALALRHKALVTGWISPSTEQLTALTSTHGTPLYVYDLSVLRQRVRRLREAMPATVLFAVKANPHEGLLRGLRGHVAGLDVASGGELERALRCGWSGAELSFAGPGKTRAELEQALAHDVSLSVESVRELNEVAALAKARGGVARVRLRLNPATTARAYRVPMMGVPSPFGIDEEQLGEAMAQVEAHVGVVDLDGLHVHPGGQCTSVGGFVAAAAASLDLCARLEREHGVRARRLNLGGGLGVLGTGEALDVEAAGRKLKAMIDTYREAMGHVPELLLEPGRWLAAPAGLYVARVVSTKQSRGTSFVVLDGGLNHHLAAAGHLFGANAPRLPLLNLSRPDARAITCTVVGPLCTPLDVLGDGVTLPQPEVGDLLGIPASGAYGPSFSPVNFLGHALPAEVVIGA